MNTRFFVRTLGTVVLGALLTGAFVPAAAASEERFRKETRIDFEEVLLEGEIKKPKGETFSERQKLKFGSLITIRKDFEPEMFRSVEKLK